MSSDKKRQYRELKRELKKAGNRCARNSFKRTLQKTPEEAHFEDYDTGYNKTKEMNGEFKDTKRYRCIKKESN